MSISPKTHRQLVELVTADDMARDAYRDAIMHIGAHTEQLNLTLYAEVPEGVFGEAAVEMRTDEKFRDAEYENRIDNATSDILDELEDLLAAEFDLKTFYTVRRNQAGINACNSRLKQLAVMIDEYQEGETEHTTWFVDRERMEIARFLPFHEAQVNYDTKALEIGIFEKVLVAYADAAHSFIENTDLHVAMIVMYLSDDPRRMEDPTHQMYTRAMKHELKNSSELAHILREMYPSLKDEPENNNGHEPPKAAPKLN